MQGIWLNVCTCSASYRSVLRRDGLILYLFSNPPRPVQARHTLVALRVQHYTVVYTHKMAIYEAGSLRTLICI